MEESFADVTPSLSPSNSSQATINSDDINSKSTKIEKPRPKFNPDDVFYDMSGEKFLVPSPRKGTDMDVMALKKTFSVRGFKILTYHDLEHGEILNKVLEISRMDHSATSCLCMAILTHGEKGGQLLAADRPYLFSDITTMLENGDKSLVNKPKLFFIQACRGDEMDAGRTVQIDGDDNVAFQVPSHADFFVMYSTVEGYVAYRNVLGSFMIQELCKLIESFHDTLDMLHIATLLNRKIAYEYSTYTPKNMATHNKKQMPEARFTLTKLFKF